jgi:hypothetical protein
MVSVFGYPIGGDRMSVTQGVVSRVDFRTYTHSVVDSHLTIQIDAAINPVTAADRCCRMAKWSASRSRDTAAMSRRMSAT